MNVHAMDMQDTVVLGLMFSGGVGTGIKYSQVFWFGSVLLQCIMCTEETQHSTEFLSDIPGGGRISQWRWVTFSARWVLLI